jgi:hypothetical protein
MSATRNGPGPDPAASSAVAPVNDNVPREDLRRDAEHLL